MTITLSTPDTRRLGEVVSALRQWQHDAAPMQLHPGDLGWHWRVGADAMAAALRSWTRDGQILAVGFLDSPEVLRLTVAPESWRDDELAEQVVADVGDPRRGVLPAGTASVETPNGSLVREVLAAAGWRPGESWTPLRRDLTGPIETVDLRVEVVGPDRSSAYTAVHRSAFGSAKLTDEHWLTMTTGLPYRDARCLLGYDKAGTAVAEATVWSAGTGRPGLLEPLGVHADHHGHGYGRAISVAAAVALSELGSSSAVVCTPSANVAAVATYRSAGFVEDPPRLDLSRDA